MADRYWVGGTGTWNSSLTTNWAASSGGASGASAPTSADNVFFDASSNVGTGSFVVTITGNSGTCANCTISGLDGAMTLSVGGNWLVYGSISFPATNLTVTGPGPINFAATSGTKTITTNGVTLAGVAVRFSGVGGTWTLQDDITSSGTADFYFSGGTVNLNTKTITCSAFYFSDSNGGSDGVRTLAGGAGSTVNVYGSGSIGGTVASVTNLTVTGTIDINFTYSGALSRSWINSLSMTAAQLQNVSFNITAGTGTVTLGNQFCNSFSTSGFSGTLANSARSIYGNFTIGSGTTCTAGASAQTFVATSGTKTITTNGVTVDFPFTFNGVGGTWALQDNLTTGSARTVTLTNGTLNINDKTLTTGRFDTNNGNTRTLAFGVGNITLTGNAATIWTSITQTGLTVSGTATVNCTYSGATGTRTLQPGAMSGANSISFNITAGTDIIGHGNGAVFRDLNFTGFSGTLTDGGATKTIYGSLTLSSTMSNTGSSSGVTFAATSGTKTFTTGGINFDNPVTFNGVGGSWQLVGDLKMTTATRLLSLTNGAFNANGYNVTVGTFTSTNSNIRTLQLGGGVWTILGSGALAWSTETTTNLTFTSGNSLIDMTSATAKTFAGGGLSYGTLRNSGAGALTISGSNTFANLRGIANLALSSSTTQTISGAFSLDGRYGSLVYLTASSTANATISKASGKVYTTFCNISKSTATGGATFRAPATPATSYGNVDGGTNSGWDFTAMGATDNPNPGAFSSFFN